MTATRADLVDAFSEAGHQLWLVGGAVRDRLLGYAHGDDDYATDATPDEVEALVLGLGVSVTTVGKRFGTIGALVDSQWHEITTFRGESYGDGTRWPDVTFGTSIDEDLARRDFTVNAIAEDARTGERRDPFQGEQDLRAGLLRAVGEPVRRFQEDPLRILRGMRFASQLGFDVEENTQAGMAATVSLLGTLSQERVTTELDRLIQGRWPERGLELLRSTGALDVVLPELAAMPGCEQNRFHQYDVWGHTVATVRAVEPPDDRVRRWAALLHDLGKPAVRHLKPNGEWGFYKHEVAGGNQTVALLDRLKMAKSDAKAVTLLVRRHMDRPNVAERRSVRRFMAKTEGRWADLLALKRADNVSHTYDDREYHDRLEAACVEVETEEAAVLRAESPLDGDDLVRLFERPAGPWIKPVKERLSALVLDGALAPGDRQAAERIARRMLRSGAAQD